MQKRAPPNSNSSAHALNSKSTSIDILNRNNGDPQQQQAPLSQGFAGTASNTTTSPSHHAQDKPLPTSRQAQMENLTKKSQWIVLAIASGCCAAFNGVFAKLTTTELTTSFATWVANLIGLSQIEGGVEVVVRILFFILNLIFNGIMWTLFTKALARGSSTTKVSILNTSANFMVTALLGALVFSESLPPLWFVGAAMLVAGNVIIGRREEGEDKGGDEGRVGEGQGRGRSGSLGNGSGEVEGLLDGDGALDLDDLDERERKRKQAEEERDILQLDSETEDEAEARNDLQLL